MFIDPLTQNWFDELNVKAQARPQAHHSYLLLDGAFVPGLHKMLGDKPKAILFESLPGCSEEARDVSPFLISLNSVDPAITAVLSRCSGWPMVSLIETTEPLERLSARLGAWCLVEADGQQFNFRFPDTRRLPAIFRALNEIQRAQLTGPALSWSYVSRDGKWVDLAIEGRDIDVVDQPKLDGEQFAMLVEDSRADEILTLLTDRGHDPYRKPSSSHALVTTALDIAHEVLMENYAALDWCEWFWRNDELLDLAHARVAFARWKQNAGEL